MEVCQKVFHFVQHKPYVSLFVTVGGMYTLYYFTKVVKRPRLVCGDKRLLQLIESHCPIAREYFWPTWWCFQSHAQTVLRTVLQSCPHVIYRSEVLRLSDGGQVKLDWAVGQSADIHNPTSACPTVIILPGLTGSSDEAYVKHLVDTVTGLGYRCVVFNNRGNGGCELLTARTYCASSTEDLENVVKHISSLYPEAPLMAVGVSLGGVILFNYLAQTGENCGLRAAICISVVWNLMASSASLRKPVNMWAFNRYLAQRLVEKFKTHRHMFGTEVNMDQVLKSTTIREFDTHFTSKMFGYESCDHYYHEASLHYKLHAIRVPVLTLNAADDPFMPLSGIPVEEALINDNIAMVITSYGGHIGFMEGVMPRHKNYMYRWVAQFVDCVFKHGNKHL